MRLWSNTRKRPFALLPRGRDGNVSILFAFALPVALLLGLGAIELLSVSVDRSRLQDMADTTALNAASQMQLVADKTLLIRTAAFATAQVSGLAATMDPPKVAYIEDRGKLAGIEVTLTARRTSFFGNLLPLGGFVIEATGRAQKLARTPLCVLSLSDRAIYRTDGPEGERDKKADPLDVQNGGIIARSCMVYSNDNIALGTGGMIIAASVQAAGRIRGGAANAHEGAAVLEDPFATTFTTANPGDCDNRLQHTVSSEETYSVEPGVLCGQLVLRKGSKLKFLPGVHHFKDGTLKLEEGVDVTGQNVTLVIWPDWDLQFTGQGGVLSLSGSTTGPWAGFAMAVHPDYDGRLSLDFGEIRKLEGVVYAPTSDLIVRGGTDPTEKTPWTVVVTKGLKVEGGRQLQINADYASSAVPVPDGVGNKTRQAGPVQLIR